MEPLLVGILILAGIAFLLVPLHLQKKAMSTQDEAVRQQQQAIQDQRDAIERTKHSIELQEKALALQETSIHGIQEVVLLQKETNKLLRELMATLEVRRP